MKNEKTVIKENRRTIHVQYITRISKIQGHQNRSLRPKCGDREVSSKAESVLPGDRAFGRIPGRRDALRKADHFHPAGSAGAGEADSGCREAGVLPGHRKADWQSLHGAWNRASGYQGQRSL